MTIFAAGTAGTGRWMDTGATTEALLTLLATPLLVEPLMRAALRAARDACRGVSFTGAGTAGASELPAAAVTAQGSTTETAAEVELVEAPPLRAVLLSC